MKNTTIWFMAGISVILNWAVVHGLIEVLIPRVYYIVAGVLAIFLFGYTTADVIHDLASKKRATKEPDEWKRLLIR